MLSSPRQPLPHSADRPFVILTALSRSEPPAWKRLIRDRLSTDERISLITSTFSDHDKAKVVRRLSRDDAQALIDAIYEVCLHTPPSPKDVPVDSY